METLILIFRCLIVGVIWAALLIPVFFKKGGALKYIITVLATAIICYVLCYIVGGYSAMINQTTLIALIALVLSWIISSAVFDKESKVKSKVIAFSCFIAGLSYIVSCFLGSVLNIL